MQAQGTVAERHYFRAEVISAELWQSRALRVDRAFELQFPERWRAQPMQSQYASLWERDTVQWLNGHGMGRTPLEAEKLRKFQCADYGGYSLPYANYGAGALVTRYISLWLFWDDAQVEGDLGWDVESVVSALTLDTPPLHGSRYLAAWFDLGQQFRRTQSQVWREALGQAMYEWLHNAKRETSLAQEYERSGACPTFRDMLACRTISIGMFPMFLLDEYVCGLELPMSVRDHELIGRLKYLASRLVGLGNDLGGLAKDLRDGWPNLAVVLCEHTHASLREAFAMLVEIHNRDVLEFDRIADGLPDFGPDVNVLIQAWIQTVRYNVFGFTYWESTAERYQELKAVADDITLSAPVVTFEDDEALVPEETDS